MRHSALWRFCVGTALAVILASCGSGAARSDDTTAADRSASPSGDAAVAQAGEIRDDFSDPESGWLRRTNDTYGAEYKNGAYVVWVDNDAENYVTSNGDYEATAEFGDTRFEITATKLSGPSDTSIGLSCRQWVDGDRSGFYFADLDAWGDATVGLYEQDDEQVLAEAQRPGLWHEDANALRLDCIGDQITFFVNGEEVLSATDGRFTQGGVGVRVGGTSTGVTRVAFDDAVITTLGS
ncbi:MAG: hypothetical protein PVJ49_08960 [Acidobacteriota bacterium]